MTAKTSQARREAFLAAVRESGNQTLAAERAKVSRSWVQLTRDADPAFKAAVAAAVADAKARLGAAADRTPGPGWRTQQGEELVVRGGNGRRLQVARAALRQWTPRVEARFLASLSTCCNVKRACASVGLSVGSAYARRHRDPAFGDRWDAAIAAGYLRLESAMLEGAARAVAGDGAAPDGGGDPACPVAPMSVNDAMQLLRLHQAGQRARRTGRPPTRATEAELTRAIEEKLDVLAKRRARNGGRLPQPGEWQGRHGGARPRPGR